MSDKTIQELAEELFIKSERLTALLMMNAPTEYEARKKAFVDLEIARAEVSKARVALDSITAVLPDTHKTL